MTQTLELSDPNCKKGTIKMVQREIFYMLEANNNNKKKIESFSKEIETINNSQKKISGLKNTIKYKNSLAGLNSRLKRNKSVSLKLYK